MVNNYVVKVNSDGQFHQVRQFIGGHFLDVSHRKFNPFEYHHGLSEYFIGYTKNNMSYYGRTLLLGCGEAISFSEWVDRFIECSPPLSNNKKEVGVFPRLMEVSDDLDEWDVNMVYCLDGVGGAYSTWDKNLPKGCDEVVIVHYRYVREIGDVVEVTIEQVAEWKKVSVDQIKIVDK